MVKLCCSLARRSNYSVDLLNDKLLNQLREDSIDEAIVNEELNSETQATLFPAHKARWQRQLVHFLHSTPVEVFVVVLVILDVIILLAMLVLELHIVELKLRDENNSTDHAIAFLRTHCGESSDVANYSGRSLMTALKAVRESGCHVNSNVTSGDGVSHDGTNGHSEAGERHKRAAAVADAHGGQNSATVHKLEVAEHVLHFCSIFILGVMVVEVLMKVVGLGKSYFRGKMEVVDGIIIFISFAMDLYFYRGIFADGFSNLATVLVIFLLWRIARIFNAILVTAKTRLEFRIRVQKRARSQLTDKVNVLQTEKETLQEHVDNLRTLCRNYKISEDVVQAAAPFKLVARRKSTTTALGSVLKMSVNLTSGLGLAAPGMAGLKMPQNGGAGARTSLLAPPSRANQPNGSIGAESLVLLSSNGTAGHAVGAGRAVARLSSPDSVSPLLGLTRKEPSAAPESRDTAEAEGVPLLGDDGREEEEPLGAATAAEAATRSRVPSNATGSRGGADDGCCTSDGVGSDIGSGLSPSGQPDPVATSFGSSGTGSVALVTAPAALGEPVMECMDGAQSRASAADAAAAASSLPG